MTTEEKMNHLLNLVVLLSPLLVVLIGWLSKKTATYLGVKVENEKVEGVLMRANDLMWTCMLNAEQTMVREIKAAKAKDSDGGETITEEEGARIKAAVIGQFKSLAGPKGLEQIMKVLGLETPELLTDWLESKLESAVATKKLMGSKVDIEGIGDVLRFKKREG